MNRRQFLRAGSIAAGALLVPACATRRPVVKYKSPNEQLNIGIIGAGGKGESNLRSVSSENIVALCDVDDVRAGKSLQQFSKAVRYRDFRKMLEEEKSLDAVVVSTPDHLHAPAAMMAMQLGRHVYCEKPLTHTIWEARMMRETAEKFGLATQMGNQGTSSDGFRRGVEIIRSGAIGPVREVHVWTNRPVWPQGVVAPKETVPVPSTLDWDLWLGPAAMRPYHPDYLPFKWRGWIDFGTGALGDMACHTANLPFMALKLGYPSRVEAESQGLTADSYPKSSIIRFDFPAREGMPPVKFTWYDGGKMPPQELFHGIKPVNSGCLLIGDKGTLYSPDDYGSSFRLLPEANFQGFQAPEPSLPRVGGAHHREWIQACKGGPKTMSNFTYAGLLTESILLGNLAVLLKQPIDWDGPGMRARNTRAADPLIRKEYRSGWMW